MDQCVSIIGNFRDLGDWSSALERVIPMRKRKNSTGADKFEEEKQTKREAR